MTSQTKKAQTLQGSDVLRLKKQLRISLAGVAGAFVLLVGLLFFPQTAGQPGSLVYIPAVLALMLFGFTALTLFRAGKLIDRAAIIKPIDENDQPEQNGQMVKQQPEKSLVVPSGINRKIVHELNNKMAIVDSQIGLIKDMLDPALGMDSSPEAIGQELGKVAGAVQRASEITKDMLSVLPKDR